MAQTKADKIAVVEKTWSRGAKFRAIQMAADFKLKPEECPEGMAEHRAGLAPEYRDQIK